MSYYERTYELPQLTEVGYGRMWPAGTHQIVKELVGFRNNREQPGFLSRYEHGINLIRLLWPNDVALYVNYDGVIIWNHFFLDIFKSCCEGKALGLTGCASSGKTFAVAVYAILMFMCRPTRTSIMVSTTAGSDAERRVWGEIKRLHQSACQIFALGTPIEYLKVITFDPSLEIGGKKEVKERDIKNGIMLVPIPGGSEGQRAMGKIIGTKNEIVIWIIDELPHMIANVLDACDNLISNVFFQLVVIGNANRKDDPHGEFCTPRDGWESVTQLTERWIANNGATILNLNGQKSPNFHPLVLNKLGTKDIQDANKSLMPFRYLWNPISDEQLAFKRGLGSVESGRKSLGYVRFAVGFWYGEDTTITILTEAQVLLHKANEPLLDRGWKKSTFLAGFDPGWSAGGDSNELCIGELAWDDREQQYLVVPNNAISLEVQTGNREDFRQNIASRVVDACIAKDIKPENLFMDINGDGGLMLAAITKEWTQKSGTFSQPTGLSSLEPCDDSSEYFNIVTQYWYQAAKAVSTGKLRGFNARSGYAQDLFSRQYESVSKGRMRVEDKKSFKKRKRRSPDAGDSFCYLVEGAKRLGFDISVIEGLSNQNELELESPHGTRAFSQEHSQLDEESYASHQFQMDYDLD